MTVTALVLRNYGCEKSRLAAEALSLALYDHKYGMTQVDPNNPDEIPDGKDENNIDRWIPFIQQRIGEVDHIIVMLSNQLNRTEPGGNRGIGLLSEVLSFWSTDDVSRRRKLIFVCIDCDLDDLKQPPGAFEQLQDIIVPLARERGVICVRSDAMHSGEPAPAEFADQVAARMNLGIENAER